MASNIPPEIITEILYRLPVKTLGRFRCVSKAFLSLLSETRFIKTHQTTLNRRHFILDPYLYSLHSLLFHDNDFKPTLGPKRLCLHLSNVDTLLFGGSCNGLVLVSADYRRFGGDILIVLNPITKEFVKLPESDSRGRDIAHGFGYDSTTDDYKVVTISRACNVNFRSDHSLHVYSLKTSSWRLVCEFPYNYTYWKCFPGVFVKGFLHWSACTNDAQLIVAFSLADETLSEVPLPDSCNNARFTIVPGEKLVILTEGGFWLMKEYGVKESWTKILLDEFTWSYNYDSKPMVFFDNDKFLVVDWRKVAMYDIEEGSLCRCIHTYKQAHHFDIDIVGVYVESLASPKLNGLEQVGRTRSRLGPCQVTLPRSQPVHPSAPHQGRVIVTLCSVMTRLLAFLTFLLVVLLLYGLLLFFI